MATRTSIRPRQLDINKQLSIIRDISELDSTDGLLLLPKDPDAPAPALPAAGEAGTSAQPAAPAPAQAPVPAPAAAPAAGAPHGKKPKPKEIPVPEVKNVPTYTRDYLPTFKIPETYIKGKGGVGYKEEDYVEYDLDNEDEDWLEAYNRTADTRLQDTKFERMLWKLELAWWDVLEPTLTPSEKGTPAHLAPTTCLPKPQAMGVLRRHVGGRDSILEAVYDYWVAKRKRSGRPLMRRLQAPTNPSDTNPYNVFRPREKSNRPLTRRRRENSMECLEKLRSMRENMLRAMELAEMVVLREHKKRKLYFADMTAQRCQLHQVHSAPEVSARMEQEAAVKLQALMAASTALDPRIAQYAEMHQNGSYQGVDLMGAVRRALLRKRRRLELEAMTGGAITAPDTLARLPPPLPMPDLEPLYAYQAFLEDVLGSSFGADAVQAGGTGSTGAAGADGAAGSKGAAAAKPPLASMPAEVAGALATGRARAYLGRCGRLVVARCDPMTWEPLEPPTATSAPGVTAGGQQGQQVMVEALAFPWQRPPPEPWAATLDINLVADCVDKAPYLAQRQQYANPVDYKELALQAAAAMQAQAAAQQPPGAAGGAGTPGAAPGAAPAAAAGAAPAGAAAAGTPGAPAAGGAAGAVAGAGPAPAGPALPPPLGPNMFIKRPIGTPVVGPGPGAQPRREPVRQARPKGPTEVLGIPLPGES